MRTKRGPAMKPCGWYLAALALVGLVGCSASSLQSPVSGGPEVGQPLPDMQVAGWHNAPGGALPDLAGKVVVLDCFATWCGPCARATPGLVDLYHRFEGHEVVFVGITPEPADAVSDVVAFSDQFDIPWAIGYGGNDVLKSLGVRAFPTMIVFGRDGIATWSSHSHAQLEQAITAALAEDPDQAKPDVQPAKQQASLVGR